MPKSKKIKVIIDTNIWISFLIGKRIQNLKELIISEKIELIFVEQILTELENVTQREKLVKYFPQEKVQELIIMLRIVGKFFKPKSKLEICRDPKDDFLLNLAIDSKANFLVSGDIDLLELKKIGITEIIDFKQFEQMTF